MIWDAGLELIRGGKLSEALEVSGVRVVEGLLLGGSPASGWVSPSGCPDGSRPPSTRLCRWCARAGQTAVQDRLLDIHLGTAADRRPDGRHDRFRDHRQHPPFFGAAADSKTRVVSAWDGAAAGEQILVGDGSSITSVRGLKARTILVAKGSAAHANVLEHLADSGLKPKDVKLVFLKPADALSAFANGQGDAWVIWEPYTAQANITQKVRAIGTAENGYWFGSASVRAGGAMGARQSFRVGEKVRQSRWPRTQGRGPRAKPNPADPNPPR